MAQHSGLPAMTKGAAAKGAAAKGAATRAMVYDFWDDSRCDGPEAWATRLAALDAWLAAFAGE